MFARRANFKQSCSELLVAWVLRLSWAVACAYPFPAFSEPVPVWATFTPENSDLPHTDILALAFGEDGALWMGTHGGGLARFSIRTGAGRPTARSTPMAVCRMILSWR